MKIGIRSKLLCSTVFAVVSSVGVASTAQAACTVGSTIVPNDTVNCAATTTANTTYTTNAATGTDRYYVSTGGDIAFLNIGSIVDGFGVGISNDATLFVNNFGGVIVNAGNPTAGGTAALDLTGTEVFYVGNAGIINGFSGNGLEIEANDSDGGVAIDAEQHVFVTTASGSAIVLTQTNAAGGSVTLNSDADLIVSNGNGISATSNGVGDIDITNGGNVVEGAGGNLYSGIYANHGGTGNIVIGNSGAIGDATGRADTGVLATHSVDGDVTITNSGAIYADFAGIDASALGAGDVTVTTTGLIDSGGIGIAADTMTGLLTVNANANVTSAGNALQLGTIGGDVHVNGTGNITSTGGVGLNVQSNGGDQVYNLTGNVSGSTDGAVLISSGGSITGSFGGASSVNGRGIAFLSGGGDVDLTVNGAVSGGTSGIDGSSAVGTLDLTTNGAVNGGSATAIVLTSTTGSMFVDINGDVTSAGGGGILATTQGGGMTFDVSGNVTALGAASEGIFLRSQATDGNNLTLTTAAGTTVQARNVGIHVEHYGSASTGNIGVTNGANIIAPAGGSLSTGILATNQGLGSVTVANSGNIGSAASRLGANGIWGYVFNGASSAPLVISNGAGSIYASTGISAVNIGTGSTTVTTGSGRVDGTINGIAASGNAGLMTITTGSGLVTGGTTGINATSTGVQDINVNGAVSGTGAGSVGLRSSTSGTRTIDIASGASIAGVASAIDLAGTGATTITNGGTLSSPFVARNSGTGAVTLRNLAGAAASGAAIFSDAADTIDNSGTYTFTGATNLAGGADAVVNRSGGTMTVNGSIDFGAGSDQFSNEAGGTLSTVTGSSIANLEVLGNAGTMNVAGTLAFTGVAPTFGNGGTLNLTGATVTGLGATTNQASGTINSSGTSSLASTGSFTNAGTINAGGPLTISATGGISNTGTIHADTGKVTLTTPTFTNGGTIDLQDGATGDILTVNGAYVGAAGARLTVDASDTVSDMLVVTGAISGTTTVDANLIGTGALVAGGVQVVDGRSTSTDDAFVLGNLTGNAGPLAAYTIRQDGADYYLAAELTEAGIQPLAAAALVPDLWHPSANEVFANLNVPYKGGPGLGGWIQAFGSRDKRGERNFTQTVDGTEYSLDTRIKTTRYGVQGGVDAKVGGGMALVGLTAGVGAHNGNGVFDVDARGWNVGLYAGFGGETGAHGELLAKHDRNRLEFQDGTFEGDRLTAKSNGVEGQFGYRMRMGGEGANIDFVAGLSHVWNKMTGVSAFNLDYRYDDLDSIRGRLGARYNVGGAMQPYVSATVLREFSRDATLYINDGVNDFGIHAGKRGTWGRIEGGIGGSPNHVPMFAAWADFGKLKGIGARVGFRFGSEGEVLPPPAPVVAPPASEPAPATQTCYDGSVILAADSCPLPPPPPTPAPAPERG